MTTERVEETFRIRIATGRAIPSNLVEKKLKVVVDGLGFCKNRRPEWGAVKVSFVKDGTPDLVVGTPKALRNKEGDWRSSLGTIDAVVALPDKGLWDDDAAAVLKDPFLNVKAIIRADRLRDENQDFEETFHLEEVVKESIRRWLRRTGKAGEEDICKDVSWKASLSGTGEDRGYTSLFADPSTRKMAKEVKEAILSIRKKAREIENAGELAPVELFPEDGKSFFTSLKGSLDGSQRRGMRIPAILLLGESGTGKSLLAQWIGSELLPGSGKFIRVNISSIQKNLIDGELFGAVSGAYTDLDRDAPGFFLANVGKTVFLDEIGDMDLSCQTRLLTFLDDGMVRPIGWPDAPFLAPVVVVAATNRPIKKWMAGGEGLFREDLFHRFDYVISLPSLRERRKDLRLLISLCLQEEEVNAGYCGGLGVRKISMDAIEYLEAKEFPGNFRELRTCLKSACLAAGREGVQTLALRHLLW